MEWQPSQSVWTQCESQVTSGNATGIGPQAVGMGGPLPPFAPPAQPQQCAAQAPGMGSFTGMASSPLRELQIRQAQQNWSPSRGLAHNDRFIPTRSVAARLDFSMLDREVVTQQVSRNISDREVGDLDLRPVLSMFFFNAYVLSTTAGQDTWLCLHNDVCRMLAQPTTCCCARNCLVHHQQVPFLQTRLNSLSSYACHAGRHSGQTQARCLKHLFEQQLTVP